MELARFSGVGFSLDVGDCLIVAGSNGAGESTLLRILAGLVRPSAGRIAFTPPDGGSIRFGPREGDSYALTRHVGLASLEVELNGELTAAENLAFFARVRGLPSDRQSILSVLERAGLQTRADDRLSSFSSGMKQRMRLLFALQHHPSLLLLDEPGSNLDEDGRTLVGQIVAQQLQQGIVVLATNDQDELKYGNLLLTLSSDAAGQRVEP